MFSCPACARRTLRSVATAARPLSASLYRAPISSFDVLRGPFSRTHSTLQSIRKGHHRRLLVRALKRDRDREHAQDHEDRLDSVRARAQVKDAQAQEQNLALQLTDQGRKKVERDMMAEARFLVDPLKLAQAIVEKLRNSELEPALALVRASEKMAVGGKVVDNVVSWNHIMDWLMSRGYSSQAWKVYNEMKKRGHKPDAHTFTILLRGYRENVNKPNAVRQAVDVYNSISAANSAVKPTTIHTNAVLSVCARAMDMDAMWTIAGRLPDHGPGSPDHVTYTTILHAISADVQARALKQSCLNGRGYDPQPLFEQAVADARKLWTDVLTRWRKGDLQLDEELVCAMGRLLMLLQDRKPYEDVLNLVQQTMSIPRDSLSQRDDTDARAPGDAARDHGPPLASLSMAQLAGNAGQLGEFRRAHVATTSTYASPGPKTLSMLLETATALRALGEGKYYWTLLTQPDGPYQVRPDAANLRAYLRLLRVSRASQTTLDVLQTEWPPAVRETFRNHATFVIAMSTCLRDKNNPNVFDIANSVMDLMQDSLGASPTPTPRLRFPSKVLTSYLQLAVATTKGLNRIPLEKTAAGDLDFERDAQRNNAFRALKRLEPEIMNAKQMIKLHLIELGEQAAVKARTVSVQRLLKQRQVTPYNVQGNMHDVADFLQSLVSVYDKIIRVNESLEDDGMGPLDSTLLNDCWMQKRKLTTYLGKLNDAAVSAGSRRVPHDPGAPGDQASLETGHEDGEAPPAEPTLDNTIPSQRKTLQRLIVRERERLESSRTVSRLSRRQVRELEKEERIRRQFPQSMLREKRAHDVREQRARKMTQRRGRHALDYQGWGGEFHDLARRQGQEGTATVVDLGA